MRLRNKRLSMSGLKLYIVTLISIKMILASGLFVYAIPAASHDDGLMVDMAWNILRGDWLGAYDNRRLVKGVTFPLFLAVNHLIGIPYTVAVVFLYGLACIAIVKLVSRFTLNQKMLGAIFTVLYFIPANISTDVSMRLYRSSLLPILVLALFAAFAQMYFDREKKTLPLKALWAGLILAAFWNLREDSVWMFPFILVVSLLTAIKLAIKNKQANSKWFGANVLYVMIPFLVLGLFHTSLKAVNQHFYGTFVRNELEEGPFPELIKAIYSVQPDEDIDYVSVPRSTVEKIYAVSPRFSTIQSSLDLNYGGGWDAADGTIDRQIGDGWFFWCLRDCMATSGYNTPNEINEFCREATDEIQCALQTGKLLQRGGINMPSALMSPWKPSYFSRLPAAAWETFWAIASHMGDTLSPTVSWGAATGISRYEAIAHNLAIKPTVLLEIKGWVVSYNDGVIADISIYQDGLPVAILPKKESEDVYRFDMLPL